MEENVQFNEGKIVATTEKVSTRNFVHPAHHNFNMVFNIMLGI